VETSLGLETKIPISGKEGNSPKGNDPSNSHLLHECLHAHKGFVLGD
jgi:hypothetical protein